MGLFFLHDDPFFNQEEEAKKIMELDKKTPVENIVSSEKEEKEIIFTHNEHRLRDILGPNMEVEMQAFNRNLKRGMSMPRGEDRPKSHNPSFDFYEKVDKGEWKPYVPVVEKISRQAPYVKKISRWHKFLNWITRSGKWEKKLTDKLFRNAKR